VLAVCGRAGAFGRGWRHIGQQPGNPDVFGGRWVVEGSINYTFGNTCFGRRQGHESHDEGVVRVYASVPPVRMTIQCWGRSDRNPTQELSLCLFLMRVLQPCGHYITKELRISYLSGSMYKRKICFSLCYLILLSCTLTPSPSVLTRGDLTFEGL